MRYLHRLLLVALLAGTAACRQSSYGPRAASGNDGLSDNERTAREELLPRARFDLGCSSSELSVTCLDPNCQQAGVSGCGKRASYVYHAPYGRPFHTSWILNSVSTEHEEPVASREPAPPPVEPRKLTAPPPDVAAGFRLGAGVDALKAACDSASRQWAAVNPQLARCSGPVVDVGFPVEVEIGFQDDKAATITLAHVPQSGWTGRVENIRTALARKYGLQSRANVKLPASCRSDDEFVQCVRSGSASLHYVWDWESGHKIQLAAGKRKGSPEPVILLRYERPQDSVDGEGL